MNLVQKVSLRSIEINVNRTQERNQCGQQQSEAETVTERVRDIEKEGEGETETTGHCRMFDEFVT